MPELSIIIPVYNVSHLIKRCLNSIVNQSLRDLDIIVINDGSSDDSVKYITPYLSDNRIQFIDKKKNEGLGAARNTGIELAKGTYIAFVDSDDWVDLDLFKQMVDYINKTEADIAVCGVVNEYNNFISSTPRYIYNIENTLSQEKALSLLSRAENNNYLISPVVWNKIYNKKLFVDNDIRFLKKSFWEDDVFSFNIFMAAEKICTVPNVFYHYYQRENSITNDFSKKHIDDLIFSFLELKKICSISNVSYDITPYFNSYFDRAISSLINMLFSNESSAKKQKEYIIYFFENLLNHFSLREAINYLDVSRIKRLFQ